MLNALSKRTEAQRLLAFREAAYVSDEVRQGYARTFEEMFLYLAELDSTCPDFCRPGR
jgi:hypothetical protein